VRRYSRIPYALKPSIFPYGGFLERCGVRPLSDEWHAIRNGTPVAVPASEGGHEPWPARQGFFLRLAFVPGYWLKDAFYKRRLPISYFAGMYGDRRREAELRDAYPRG